MIDFLFYFCLFICGGYVVVQLLILWGLHLTPKQAAAAPSSPPRVSILIAARNEEANLRLCLDSILRLKYPTTMLDVWIGNDNSTDGTAKIVQEYTAKHPHIHLVNITQNIGMAKGKANVLAQLAHKAQGDYLFITDADIVVNPFWIQSLIMHFDKQTGIVSGYTVVEGKGLFSNMQRIDWLYFMGILLGLHRLGFISTAVGNNMCVRKDAYWSTGGYEQIPFSITEDFKLQQEVIKNGYTSHNVLELGSINLSKPVPDMSTLLNQRKRWLIGAADLPMYWWLIFGIFGLYMPTWILLFIINPALAVYLFLARMTIQNYTIQHLSYRTGTSIRTVHLVWYELYMHYITLRSGLHYLLLKPVEWKNRKYTK
jgi:1,2-diacylglycerol 3-beta-glucosyltransferase